jgi:hypothetical protein
MKHTKISKILLVLFAVVLCYGPVGLAEPMGTGFTYQGRLIDNNQPADGLYDFQFKLYDSESDGNKIGGDVNRPDVNVIDGYFTVDVDFGNVFDGNARWLKIGVRPGDQNDPNDYNTLSPRQQITPTPYAIYAKSSGGDNDWMVSGNDMYSIPSGNVGIGTTGPGDKLDVQTGTNRFFRVGTASGYSYPADFNTGGVYVGMSRPQDGSLTEGMFSYDSTGGARNNLGLTSRSDIVFMTGGGGFGQSPERVRIDSSGNVGIGTTSPGYTLTVNGPYDSPQALIGNDGSNGIFFEGDGTSSHYNWLIGQQDQVSGLEFTPSTAAGGTTFSTPAMVILSTGNVGIGITSPAERLEVNGNIVAAGIIDVRTAVLREPPVGPGIPVVIGPGGVLTAASSSKRFKTNIQNLETDSHAVLQLKPVRFQWKTTGQEDIGLIAEDVEQVLRDLVIYDSEGRPEAVKYDRVALYLLSVVKELEAKNRSLEQRVEALEETMQQLAGAKEVQQ